MSFAVGRLDLSESRSTHAMSAMQRTDWTLQGQSGEEEKGAEASQHCDCQCSFLSLQQCLLAHLSVNSPSMLLAAAFPCWLWAEEVPKITRRALPLVEHSLWWPQGRFAYSLQPPPSFWRLCSDFLWLPPPQPPSGASTCAFIAFLSEPRRVEGPL